ncbi:hypothetical protein Tco_0794848 [Tanacetum coccineum]
MDNTDRQSLPDSPISLITDKICKLNSFLESLNLVPLSSDTQFIFTKENDGDIVFVEFIKKYDDSSEEELEGHDNVVTGDICEALGGNTCTLDSIWEETGEDCNSTRRLTKIRLQTVETASTFLVTPSEHTKDDVKIFPDDVKVTDSIEARGRFTG